MNESTAKTYAEGVSGDDLAHALLSLWQGRWWLLLAVVGGALVAAGGYLVRPVEHVVETRIGLASVHPYGRVRQPAELANLLCSRSRVLKLAGEAEDGPVATDPLFDVSGELVPGTELVRFTVRSSQQERSLGLTQRVVDTITREDASRIEVLRQANHRRLESLKKLRDWVQASVVPVEQADKVGTDPRVTPYAPSSQGGVGDDRAPLVDPVAERSRVLLQLEGEIAKYEERDLPTSVLPTRVVYGPDPSQYRGPLGLSGVVSLGAFMGLVVGIVFLLLRHVIRRVHASTEA